MPANQRFFDGMPIDLCLTNAAKFTIIVLLTIGPNIYWREDVRDDFNRIQCPNIKFASKHYCALCNGMGDIKAYNDLRNRLIRGKPPRFNDILFGPTNWYAKNATACYNTRLQNVARCDNINDVCYVAGRQCRTIHHTVSGHLAYPEIECMDVTATGFGQYKQMRVTEKELEMVVESLGEEFMHEAGRIDRWLEARRSNLPPEVGPESYGIPGSTVSEEDIQKIMSDVEKSESEAERSESEDNQFEKTIIHVQSSGSENEATPVPGEEREAPAGQSQSSQSTGGSPGSSEVE